MATCLLPPTAQTQTSLCGERRGNGTKLCSLSCLQLLNNLLSVQCGEPGCPSSRETNTSLPWRRLPWVLWDMEYTWCPWWQCPCDRWWPGVPFLDFPTQVSATAASSLHLFQFTHLACSCVSLLMQASQPIFLFSWIKNKVTLFLLFLCLLYKLSGCLHSINGLCDFPPSLPLIFLQEKRRQQDEQDRARREMEDEKIRLQQLKVWHTHTRTHVEDDLTRLHSCTHILTQPSFHSAKTLCRLIPAC